MATKARTRGTHPSGIRPYSPRLYTPRQWHTSALRRSGRCPLATRLCCAIISWRNMPSSRPKAPTYRAASPSPRDTAGGASPGRSPRMVPASERSVWFEFIVACGPDVSHTMSESRPRTALQPSLVPKGLSPRSRPRKVALFRSDSSRASAPARSMPLSPALRSWSLVSSRVRMRARQLMPPLPPLLFPSRFDDRSRKRTLDPLSAPWSPARSDPLSPFELRSRYSSAAEGLDRITGQRCAIASSFLLLRAAVG